MFLAYLFFYPIQGITSYDLRCGGTAGSYLVAGLFTFGKMIAAVSI